jgi:hypothetical protein
MLFYLHQKHPWGSAGSCTGRSVSTSTLISSTSGRSVPAPSTSDDPALNHSDSDVLTWIQMIHTTRCTTWSSTTYFLDPFIPDVLISWTHYYLDLTRCSTWIPVSSTTRNLHFYSWSIYTRCATWSCNFDSILLDVPLDPETPLDPTSTWTIRTS